MTRWKCTILDDDDDDGCSAPPTRAGKLALHTNSKRCPLHGPIHVLPCFMPFHPTPPHPAALPTIFSNLPRFSSSCSLQADASLSPLCPFSLPLLLLPPQGKPCAELTSRQRARRAALRSPVPVPLPHLRIDRLLFFWLLEAVRSLLCTLPSISRPFLFFTQLWSLCHFFLHVSQYMHGMTCTLLTALRSSSYFPALHTNIGLATTRQIQQHLLSLSFFPRSPSRRRVWCGARTIPFLPTDRPPKRHGCTSPHAT